jgi:hypothetical protein
MADSTRLKILKALTAQLETITPANGYDHDLTQKVFRGRDKFGANEEVPFVSVLEYLRPDQFEDRPVNQNKNREEWDLLIQGFVKDDYQNPSDPAHALLADVKKSLAEVRDETSQAYLLGKTAAGKPQILDLRMDGGIVRPPDEASSKVTFYLRVTITFIEYTHDPYK